MFLTQIHEGVINLHISADSERGHVHISSGLPPPAGEGNRHCTVMLKTVFWGIFLVPCRNNPGCGSASKESACNMRDLGLIPGLGRSPGEGKGYPLQYSGLENPMDCIVHRVAESRT